MRLGRITASLPGPSPASRSPPAHEAGGRPRWAGAPAEDEGGRPRRTRFRPGSEEPSRKAAAILTPTSPASGAEGEATRAEKRPRRPEQKLMESGNHGREGRWRGAPRLGVCPGPGGWELRPCGPCAIHLLCLPGATATSEASRLPRPRLRLPRPRHTLTWLQPALGRRFREAQSTPQPQREVRVRTHCRLTVRHQAGWLGGRAPGM